MADFGYIIVYNGIVVMCCYSRRGRVTITRSTTNTAANIVVSGWTFDYLNEGPIEFYEIHAEPKTR